MVKTCNKCKVEKPLLEFHRHPKSKDGRDWKCKSCQSIYDTQKYKDNPEPMKIRVERWRQNNMERNKRNHRRQYRENKEQYKKWAYDSFKRRYENDPYFRFKHNVRTRIKSSIKNRSNSCLNLLGCTIEEYYSYIENQFDKNMNWDN